MGEEPFTSRSKFARRRQHPFLGWCGGGRGKVEDAEGGAMVSPGDASGTMSRVVRRCMAKS